MWNCDKAMRMVSWVRVDVWWGSHQWRQWPLIWYTVCHYAMWVCRYWWIRLESRCERSASDDRYVLLLMAGGLWVHASDWPYMLQGRILSWLFKRVTIGMVPGIIADEMQLISVGRCYRKRLFHESVGLVTVPIRAIGIHAFRVTLASWCSPVLPCRKRVRRWSPTLPFHLTVCKKAP